MTAFTDALEVWARKTWPEIPEDDTIRFEFSSGGLLIPHGDPKWKLWVHKQVQTQDLESALTVIVDIALEQSQKRIEELEAKAAAWDELRKGAIIGGRLVRTGSASALPMMMDGLLAKHSQEAKP